MSQYEIARRLINGEWVTGPVLEDSGGAPPATQATSTTLTNAQVLALPSTPVELIPAQGVGTVIVALRAALRMEWVADYTNIDAAAVIAFPPGVLNGLLNTLSSSVSDLLAGGGPDGTWAFVSATHRQTGNVGQDWGLSGLYDADVANVPLTISATNGLGDFTGGDPGNSLTVTVTYQVVTFG